MEKSFRIVIEPDETEGWICYNTQSAEDVKRAVLLGGWEMPREEALRIFGEENLPLVCQVNTKVSSDGKTVQWLPPTEAELDAEAAEQSKSKRNRLLAETDYLAMPDYPLTEKRRAEIMAYRQALRDITEQEGWPRSVAWPVLPEEEKDGD